MARPKPLLIADVVRIVRRIESLIADAGSNVGHCRMAAFPEVVHALQFLAENVQPTLALAWHRAGHTGSSDRPLRDRCRRVGL